MRFSSLLFSRLNWLSSLNLPHRRGALVPNPSWWLCMPISLLWWEPRTGCSTPGETSAGLAGREGSSPDPSGNTASCSPRYWWCEMCPLHITYSLVKICSAAWWKAGHDRKERLKTTLSNLCSLTFQLLSKLLETTFSLFQVSVLLHFKVHVRSESKTYVQQTILESFDFFPAFVSWCLCWIRLLSTKYLSDFSHRKNERKKPCYALYHTKP